MAARSTLRSVAVLVLLLGALAEAQKPPSAQQKKAAKAHFEQGRAFYDAGAWDDAVREYQAAYALVPLPELQFNIGQALRMKGDKPKAIEAYGRYLERAPDGPLADEARNHIAALKLKIQIEEAEAGRRKADEEAAAARRQAAEAEAARRRAEADAAARGTRQRDDEERLRRVAAEEAEAARRRKAAAEADRERRLEEARGQGTALRVTGIVTLVVGALAAASMALPVSVGNHAKSQLDQWNQQGSRWTAERDKDVRDLQSQKTLALALGATGAGLLVAGTVLYVVGVRVRSGAVERVPPVSLAAALTPGGGALVLGGRF